MAEQPVINFAHTFDIPGSAITDFIRDNWLRETLLSDEAFYQWQFRDPVANNGKDYSVLMVSGGEVVGFMGLHKRPFIGKNKMLNGAELTTWIIREDFQGKGLARPMLQFIKDNFDIAFGANITKAALSVYLRTGYGYIKEVPRTVKIYNYANAAVLGDISAVIRKAFPCPAAGEDTARLTAYSITDFDKVAGNGHQEGYIRSAEHLQWRFRHPVYDYRIISLTQSSARNCYVIYRIEQVEGAAIMIVADILYDGAPGDIDFSGLDAFARDANIDMIEFYTTHSALLLALRRHGFLSLADLSEFIDIAYLYNPLEIKKSRTYSFIYYIKDYEESGVTDLGSLYLSKADCDLDRPNHAYLEKIKNSH